MGKLWLALAVVTTAACHFTSNATGDGGGPTIDASSATCGNGIVEPGEDCDDGDTKADSYCDSMCHFTCGNGVVDSDQGETCDTSIASGPGSCPTACDDGDACTTDVLEGSGCTAQCVYSPITSAIDGDGCCPAGANANTDNDCTAMCGNGVLEAGELCDPGIVAGAGACPESCDDDQSCTTDTLVSGGTCQAMCTFTAITMPINNDGCCPAGANPGDDNDCSAACGNGFVDVGETCDTAIASGAGKCPTACDDGIACTSNVLSNPGTCTAACVYPAITMPINGDGCCPTGANANDDNDCAPVCGNGVVEAGEQCDDGNTDNTDACDNTCHTHVVATAFRFNTLELRDPHTWINVPILGCKDITDNKLLGEPSVNDQLLSEITTDSNGDGLLDLSPTLVFRPLDQVNAHMPALQLYFADCTSPLASTSCKPNAQVPVALTATNQSTGTCLATIAGTVKPYSPAVTTTTGPCFVSASSTIAVSIVGIPLTLHDARIAATYSGSPATQVVNGLLVGFMTETDANATNLPSDLPLVGGKPLSTILAGGTGACASFSDKDTDNGTSGWWFYLNFTAPVTTWSDN